MPNEPKPEIDLNDINLKDDVVAEAFAKKCPPEMRLAFGENLRGLILSVTSRERARVKTVLQLGVRFNSQQVRGIEASIQAAIALGDNPKANALGVKRVEAIARVLAISSAVKVVGLEPGGCTRCGGVKMVPATVAMPGGQKPMLPCPVCVPAQEEETPAGAPDTAVASSSSNGTSIVKA